MAGEVGITPAGDVVKGFEAQTRTAWENIAEVLKSAGMSYGDIVKMDSYLVGLEYYEEYVDLLREILGNAKPASKAIIVPSLVLPGLLLEVEVTAAQRVRRAADTAATTTWPVGPTSLSWPEQCSACLDANE